MGQSQAYKRRHPGKQGQISAQEYTGLTFRGIAAARRTEGEDSRTRQQGARSARTGQVAQQPGQGQAAQTRCGRAVQAQSTEPGRQQGAQGQRATLLNMRHTETSNCAIVLAWHESERGRARQGSTPAHQLAERDSREAVSFVLPSDAYASRPPGQRGAA